MSRIDNIRNALSDLLVISKILRKTNIEILKESNDAIQKAFYLCIENLCTRIEDSIFLINLNYKDNHTLHTSKYENIDGIYVFVRGIIESIVFMEVLKSYPEVANKFIEYMVEENNYILIKYKESSSYKKIKITKKKYKKNNWMRSIIKSRWIPLTLNNLIDFLKLPFQEEFKFLINESNNKTHPMLYNDYDYFLSVLKGNSELIDYFINIIENGIDNVIHTLNRFEEFKKSTYYSVINEIKKIIYSQNNEKFYISYESKMLRNRLSIDNEYGIKRKVYDINISARDNIHMYLTLFSVILDMKQTQYGNFDRRGKSISKLIYHLGHNVREFIISFEEKHKNIFYIKGRYILENISLIYALIISGEERLNCYAAHTDIRNYLEMKSAPKELLHANFIEDFDQLTEKKIINSEEDITIQEGYTKNIFEIKNYYKDKHHITINNKKIIKANSWAINLFEGKDKEKIPSIIDFIINFIKSNKENFTDKLLKNERLFDYIKGFYSESSSYCHVSFKVYEIMRDEERETFYIIMSLLNELIKILMDNNDILKYTFKHETQKAEGLYTLEETFDHLLNENRNFVTFSY